MTADDIGIVVIGRNEGSRLIDCLRSARSNVHCVVYVDSGSTDGSIQAAQQLGVNVVTLNTADSFTAARARNRGFEALRKLRPDIRLVQFVDGDCELDSNWLNAAANFISQRDAVAVVCGRRWERHPSRSIYNRLCDLEWDTPVGETLSCGGDALVRVDPFEAVGGFTEELIAGEESELCLRLRAKGWRIWRLDAKMTRHDAAIEHFGQWWIRSVRGGYAMTEVSRLHWQSSNAIWKRQLVRAVFWGCVLPALIGVGALINSLALAVLLVYPVQVCRIAIARGPIASNSWAYAIFMTLAKFAEFQGVLTFCWRRLCDQSIELIEYK